MTSQADADYLSAVRSGESDKAQAGCRSVTLFGQALIGSKQYARRRLLLSGQRRGNDATRVTFYLLEWPIPERKTFPKRLPLSRQQRPSRPMT